MSSKSETPRRKRRRTLKDDHPVIYCIEGIHRQDDDDTIDYRSQDISFRSALEFLRDVRYWDFRHRDVATVEELTFYMSWEWPNCAYHSILNIFSHGQPGRITLSDKVEVQLTDSIGDNGSSLSSILEDQLGQSHIHFSGCSIMRNRENWIHEFFEKTGASVVSGYEVDVDWNHRHRPAALADLFLFSQLSEVDYYDKRSYTVRMKKIKEEMDERFGDCRFTYELG